MPAPNAQQQISTNQLIMVGGNKFGRYPKISSEQTFNFIVSDGFLVPYAGYKFQLDTAGTQKGRALYASSTANIMLAVWGSTVYVIDKYLAAIPLTTSLVTSSGNVYMAENNNQEICITDGQGVYVYTTNTNALIQLTFAAGQIPAELDSPGFISFQNGRLIIANEGTTNWYLSELNNAKLWPNTSSNVGSLQSKPDKIKAAVPIPGGGNNLIIFGHNVAEIWQDVGNALFPYQRNPSYNSDFGCLNASSIASLDKMIVWIGVNEQSGPVLLVYQGNTIQPISTDGINFVLGNLSNPSNCTGFLYQQDGHIIYQFTFPDDNLSYAYDFNTKIFFTVTDENLNYHIARDVVYYNREYYFVSLKGGNLFNFSSNYYTAQYGETDIREIPRIRICPPMRLADSRYYIGKSLTFTIEQGQPNALTNTLLPNGLTQISSQNAVDLSISYDGGETFGSNYRLNMNATGNRKSRFDYQRLGIMNDATFKLRFNGMGRFVCTDGVVEVYL